MSNVAESMACVVSVISLSAKPEHVRSDSVMSMPIAFAVMSGNVTETRESSSLIVRKSSGERRRRKDGKGKVIFTGSDRAQQDATKRRTVAERRAIHKRDRF